MGRGAAGSKDPNKRDLYSAKETYNLELRDQEHICGVGVICSRADHNDDYST